MWTLSAALLRKPHRGGYAEQLIGLNQSTMTRYHPQSNRSCSGILTVWYVLAIGNQPVGWAWAQQAERHGVIKPVQLQSLDCGPIIGAEYLAAQWICTLLHLCYGCDTQVS